MISVITINGNLLFNNLLAVYPQYTYGGTGVVFVVPGVREQFRSSRLWPVSTPITSAATARGAPAGHQLVLPATAVQCSCVEVWPAATRTCTCVSDQGDYVDCPGVDCV